MFFVSCSSHAFASVHCCIVVTSWLLLVIVIVFVTFPCGILGQVWYLIVLFPDLCCLSYFYKMKPSARALDLEFWVFDLFLEVI